MLVAGTSASGKTTLARGISQRLDVPHIEIDALFHGPDWTPRDTFLAEVDEFSSRPEWVTEWQYSSVRPLLAERAELVVWLDLSRTTVMRQVVRRTVRRSVRKEQLWNGNQEPPLRTVFTDPDHIIRWAWKTHHENANRIAALLSERPELAIVRLPSHTAARRWLDGVLGVTAS
ncbi:AAA family ATPase [Kribbella pittospori]|uniref:AAA family ATPase n=1 Tax=Kribbella pittospori TaxID=722689 RepID=UPI001EDE056A|nr:AAA family ATPase [Kribbella pittospori]